MGDTEERDDTPTGADLKKAYMQHVFEKHGKELSDAEAEEGVQQMMLTKRTQNRQLAVTMVLSLSITAGALEYGHTIVAGLATAAFLVLAAIRIHS